MTPYSRVRPAPDIIALMEALLTEKATMLFHTASPSRLSYRLREGIYASKYHDDTTKYLILRVWYSFEVHDRWVRARWMGSSDVDKVEVKPSDTGASRRLRTPRTPSDPKPLVESVLSEEELAQIGKEVKETLDTCILPNISNLAGVVEGANRFGVKVLEVFFPEAVLSKGDLTRLYRWATEKGWAIIDHEDGGLTLSRKDVEEELKWTP